MKSCRLAPRFFYLIKTKIDVDETVAAQNLFHNVVATDAGRHGRCPKVLRLGCLCGWTYMT